MSKEIELSIMDTPKIFITIPNGEIIVSKGQDGMVRITVENNKLGIYPNGSNSVVLKVER